jgi:hypothetical protein
MATSPSDEEMAAIVAAYQAVNQRVVLAPEDGPTASPAWRFSGRWWARPVAVRRYRPWI